MVAKIPIGPNERLGKIGKEHHVRRQKGHYHCYILEDKSRRVLLIGQKLSDLCQAVNEEFVTDASDKISVTGLWQIIGSSGERCNGWTKHRWRCSAIPIELAHEAFNSQRENFADALLLGNKSCYSVCV